MYVVKRSAVAKTDVILNSLVEKNWNSAIGGSLGGSGNYLVLDAPKNVLTALEFTCSATSNIGLLTALNYSNLVNATKLAHSPEVQNGIAKGKR